MFYILYTPKKKLTVSFILKDVNIVFIMTPFAVICAVATLAIFVKRLQCVSARCTPSTILNCKGRETSFASCDSALDNCVLTPLVKRCPAIQDWVCVFKCWNCTIFGVSIASKTCIIYEESRVQLNKIFLYHAIENTANQKTGKSLYIRRHYIQPSHRAPRVTI